ncbi:nuclear transport factor 2 family protein [Luteimonas sp. e5]
MRRALMALLAAGVLMLAAGCRKPDEEQRLRQQVAVLQEAITTREAGTLNEVLAENFVGPDGMDRREARRLAAAMFLRHRDITLRSGPLDVEMQGEDSARVATTVWVSGGSGGLLPEQAQLYRFDSGWRLQKGQWRLVSAQWQRAGDGE